ncbi:MAG: adenylyl cyclase, partial [Gammaproteobacteria bacterium]|nr:adenylyl cyclase [Gammaproteobacteria bacterium]
MSLFAELKRRNVFRVAAAYLVIGWLLAQVSVTLESALNLPDWFDSVIVSTLLIGFPIALLFSWAFEITPEGLKKEKDIHPDQSITFHTAKKLDLITLVAAFAVFALIGWQQFNQPTVIQTIQQTSDSLDLDSRQTDTSTLANRVIIIEDASIAVLPFVDMSPQGDQSYFSDGVSEELLNLLASIPELRVTSRSSAFSLKDRGLSIPEIAERLKVSYVLDGSVRKSGDQLRISAQLINGRSDTQLWSKNFDRTMENIFQIQDEIAGDVVEQIKGTLNIAAPEQRKTDPEAYALFLKARQNRRLGTAQGYNDAIELYRSALAIDANYPPAWDELAAVYQSQALTGLRSADEGFRMGRQAALEAIKVDPSYALAYGSLAFIAQYHEADLAVAVQN